MFGKNVGHLTLNSFTSRIDFWIGTILSTFLINSLGLVLPIFIIQIYDRVISNKAKETLYAFFMITMAALIIELILKILRSYISAWYEARFSFKTINTSVEHILHANLNAAENVSPSQHLSNINAVDSLADVFSGANITVFCDGPFILVYYLLLYIIHPIISYALILVSLLMFIYHYYDYHNLSDQLTVKKKNTNAKTRFLVEALNGIHTVKSLGLEEQFLRRYEKLEKKSILDSYNIIQRQLATGRVMTVFSQIILISAVMVCALLFFNKQITVGGMAASVLISGKLMQPIAKLIMFFSKLARANLAYEDVKDIFALESDLNTNKQKYDIEEGSFALKNVSFGYDDDLIFENVNLFIPPKAAVAIHGDGLVGKSTLLNLLAGLYMPKEGNIFIDKQNIKDLDIEYLRNQIGYMFEGGSLFQGTILENITMFNDELNEKALDVCAQIGILKTIENMALGFKTEVGKGAVDFLSKGDKQIIMMARAILNNPSVLFFDEANSALDRESDRHFIAFLRSQLGKKTIVIISHRPSINKMANVHLLIKDKKVIKAGTENER